MEKFKNSIFVPKLPFLGKIIQVMAKVYSRNFENIHFLLPRLLKLQEKLWQSCKGLLPRIHPNHFFCLIFLKYGNLDTKIENLKTLEFNLYIFYPRYFSRMGLEMDRFRCTLLCSCRSFCCSRRNFLLRFVRCHLLAQKAGAHARSDVFKRTHFTWRRSPLRFCLPHVPLFGSKTIPRNRFILDTVRYRV